MIDTIIQAGLWLLVIAFVAVGVYFGTRSKRRNVVSTGPTASWSAVKVVGWICYALVLIALVSVALFMGSGSSVKGIWATSSAQLAAANTATGTATPQTSTVAAVPTAVANAAPVNPDVLEFNSVEDLLNGYEEQARGRSVKVKGKINGFTLTDNSVELESTPNERVVCNFAPGEREKFVNLDPERDQQITATLGNRIDLGETPMSGKRTYKIDLMGCRLGQ
jgi:hypothetical protein